MRRQRGGTGRLAAGAKLNARRICLAADLLDGGSGRRFTVCRDGDEVPAFVVRHRGRVQAFLNRCGHLPVELDWEEGRFFDASGLYLVCATHGALYAADTGACLGGRCNGRGLTPVAVVEADGWVVLKEEGSNGV